MIILATVEMQEKLSLIDPNQFQLRDSLPAKIYLSNCICRLYFDGFYYDNNFYKGEKLFTSYS